MKTQITQQELNTLVITGQTGTGKTSIAIKIAKALEGEIISADSRQIYKEMDIGTGKVDSKEELTQKDTQWFLKKVPIYGINLVNPDEYYSAGDFAPYARKILTDNSKANKYSIVIGGTGFYLKSLFDPDETISIPQNNKLRAYFMHLEQTVPHDEFIKDLHVALKEVNPSKLGSMNHSDLYNPRRLLRAIEVALYEKNEQKESDDETFESPTPTNNSKKTSSNWIGLYAPKDILADKIKKRVDMMFDAGLEEEVRNLANKYSWEAPGLKTIGYKEWKEYFENHSTIAEIKENILRSHLQYARKQLIYLKRFPFINWINIANPNWESKIITNPS